MSLTVKRMFLILFGILGALALWPCLLALQYLQPAFPSYLWFSIAQGLALGAVFGALFGSFEGIVVSSRPKAIQGLAFGAVFGAAAGAFGVIAGQLFLFALGSKIWAGQDALRGTGLAAANGIAWTLIGVFLALIEGLRARSTRKLLVGLVGGILGGLAGGIALFIISNWWPGNQLALLAALLVFGSALSLFYSLFENRFSSGALMLLNGQLKGKEYHVLSRKMRLGSSADCDIVLKGYPEVAPHHATLSQKGGRLYLERAAEGARLLVNDDPVSDKPLRADDVLTLGRAKLIYGYFG